MLQVLTLMGLRPSRVVMLKDVPLGNGNWLVETATAERFVLRRYRPQVTQQDLAYAHAVLGHLASVGWVVPAALGAPIFSCVVWSCLPGSVPAEPIRAEDAGQRRRRGRDLARL